MQKIANYINGEMVAPVSQSYIDNYNPAQGVVYSLIPDSDERDVAMAYEAAHLAFPAWSQKPAQEKFKILMKIADLISENLEELARAECIDNGKPIKLARTVDIPRAASNFSFYAQAVTQFWSESHAMEHHYLNYTLRQPLGVVACISPWNLPLYLFTWKIAPALAAGNCVIAKPSEVTPMTAYLLSKICIQAGLPKGVLNIVHGNGPKTGMSMVTHPHIHAISFTGGTKTGADIARVAAPMFKKLSLELGGKNPNIIFADCDFDEMLRTTLRSSFSNQGQICLCGSRIFVEKPIYEKFKQAFVSKVSKMQVGNPLHEDTKLGAIVSEQHFKKILSYIDLAQAEGGTVLCGGKAVTMEGEFKNGWYMSPAVIEGLPFDCRTNQEEIFGPIVTITPFETEEEVLMMANSVSYGLSSTVWTQDITRAHRIASYIQAGIVWINCWLVRDLRTPFGGIKSSGVGREGGFEALRFFTEPKNVCLKI